MIFYLLSKTINEQFLSCVLGPLLFLAYTNDLPLSSSKSYFHLLSDNTSIYDEAENLNQLQRVINSEQKKVLHMLSLGLCICLVYVDRIVGSEILNYETETMTLLLWPTLHLTIQCCTLKEFAPVNLPFDWLFKTFRTKFS